MKILKHKSIEFSEVLLSELEKDIRMDSEYFQGYYVKYAALVKSKTNLRVNEFAFVTDGIHASIDFDEESNINLISAKAPKEFGFDLSGTGYISNKQHTQNQRTALQKHDVIISTVGTIGNCSLVTPEILPANSDRHVGIVRINQENKVSPYFLTAYLNTKYGKAATMRETAGNVQLNLYIRNIKQLTIPTPTIKLQDEIDKLIIEAHRQKLFSEKQYQEAEQILITELGLENWKPKSKKFKLHGVPFEVENTTNSIISTDLINVDRLDAEYWHPKYDEFSDMLKKNKSIKFLPLGKLVTWVKGIEIGSKEYLEEGSFPFIRVSNITNKGFNYSSTKYVKSETFAKLKNYQIKKGEILLSKDGTAGIAYLVREDITGIQSSGILRLTNTSKLPSAYIELVLNSMIVQIQIERKMSGAIIQHLKVTEAMKFTIPEIPSVKKVTQKVETAFVSIALSKHLLTTSKRAIEIFIEQDEKTAIKFIKDNI